LLLLFAPSFIHSAKSAGKSPNEESKTPKIAPRNNMQCNDVKLSIALKIGLLQ
jgi:hypothetical protein